MTSLQPCLWIHSHCAMQLPCMQCQQMLPETLQLWFKTMVRYALQCFQFYIQKSMILQKPNVWIMEIRDFQYFPTATLQHVNINQHVFGFHFYKRIRSLGAGHEGYLSLFPACVCCDANTSLSFTRYWTSPPCLLCYNGPRFSETVSKSKVFLSVKGICQKFGHRNVRRVNKESRYWRVGTLMLRHQNQTTGLSGLWNGVEGEMWMTLGLETEWEKF